MEPLLSVVAHVEVLWELAVVVDLRTLHRVKVKLKALERSYQVAGQSLDALALESINFLVALLAEVLVVFVEHIALNKGVETLFDRLFVFDGNADCEKVLSPVVLVWASLADDLVGHPAAKVMVDRICLRSLFYSVLQTVQETAQILIYVHLFNDVGRVSVKVLKRMTESLWVDVHLLGHQKPAKQFLPLFEHVVLIRCVIVVWVLNAENIVAEGRNHEQLLVDAVHVADAGEILDPHVTSQRLLIVVERDLPIAFFTGAPSNVFVKLCQEVECHCKVLEAVTA
jgi:hypothetical protein